LSCVEPRRLVDTSSTVTAVTTSASVIIHAEIATVQNASHWLAPNGWMIVDLSFSTPSISMVFTLPRPIAAIALQNKDVVYNILFRAVGETLRTIAADSKHLGAQLGFFAVLHTWGQALLQNPHSRYRALSSP